MRNEEVFDLFRIFFLHIERFFQSFCNNSNYLEDILAPQQLLNTDDYLFAAMSYFNLVVLPHTFKVRLVNNFL